MAENSKIEWTDNSFNPIRARYGDEAVGHFCEKISTGCKNCYASRMQPRFGMFPYLAENRPKVELFLDEKMLLKPLSWKLPKRIFVCSMTDLFYGGHSFEWINKVFAVAALCPQHTFQILTKRPETMGQYIVSIGNAARDDKWFLQGAADEIVDNCGALEGHPWPLPNVHLGVSCENQKAADERVPWLLESPAAVRFISAEPLLGEISFKRIRMPEPLFGWIDQDALTGDLYRHARKVGFGGQRLDWIIVGSESGPGARPMDEDWVRYLRDDCVAAGVAFFYKQKTVKGKKIGLPELDGWQWAEFPKQLEVVGS